jgi:large subunit ribosomal protein L13
MMKTIYVNPADVERRWYVIDATDVVLGKLAVEAAKLLRGKNKPEFSPHQEIGDYVVVVNADKVRVTGRKASQKMYHHHSGYPGALTSTPFSKMIARKPAFPIEHAVRGMLPKNRLGRKLFTNLKVYAGESHPHGAQKPEAFVIE